MCLKLFFKPREKLTTTNDLDKIGKTLPSSVGERVARGEEEGDALLQNLILGTRLVFKQNF